METKHIAINDMPEGQTGAIVYWTRSGAISIDHLQAAWEARGLDTELLPELPGPEKAMRRAVNEMRAKDQLVRPLEKGGYALVSEDAEGDDLDYNIRARVKIELDGDGNKHLEVLLREFPSESDERLAEKIRIAYAEHRQQLAPEDMTVFLTKMLARQQAVLLREHGGVYFVPRGRLEEWKRIADAVREASSTRYIIYEIPALDSKEAMEAIFDAINREAEAEAAAMDAELEKHYSGVEDDRLGSRALSHRLDKLAILNQKLATYEGVLGHSLSELRDRLEHVRANITLAAIELEAQAAQEAA